MAQAGDPLSPLLFNLVGDVLAKMLMKASGGGRAYPRFAKRFQARGFDSSAICR
jgi:hypothetical protein